ncbi:MAG: hypothetical protein EAX90_08995 [Candidatus Heimdallarchaeota archaeon]|nr:hypothetical protein [Candidatus Heimdallarchaeota archaeon]
MNGKKKLIKKLQNGKYNSIAIIGHTSADPDSIASAYGVEFIMRNFHPKARIDVLVDGISDPTKELITYYNSEFSSEANNNYDLIIIVDVNVPNQLGVFKDFVLSFNKNDIVIIDHHAISDLATDYSNFVFIDDERTSASEIICELIFELKLKPSVQLLTILLSGIIYDSRRFYSMNKNLLKILEKIFDFNVNYDLAVKLVQRDYENSERIARLKCASRLQIQKIHGWQIAWSRIGSHEGSCARSILDLGADVAIIYSKRKKETRLNVRASHAFYLETQVHFGRDIMSILGKEYNGDGGGHSTAAALNIPSEITETEMKLATFKLLENQLKNNVKG